jgi:hypothetical protein
MYLLFQLADFMSATGQSISKSGAISPGSRGEEGNEQRLRVLVANHAPVIEVQRLDQRRLPAHRAPSPLELFRLYAISIRKRTYSVLTVSSSEASGHDMEGRIMGSLASP